MLYGEIHPSGHFRFVNFGHPPPLVFSTEIQSFTQVGSDGMAQFLVKVMHDMLPFERLAAQRHFFEALDAAKARDAPKERPPKAR